MFGLEFLFGAALWALPLAGLPVLLHLLFRRKSPIVPFSTLRFIRASIQHTAARRKIQRWLLLACRALLLLLLIWAMAQPAKMLASSWFGGGDSLIAAIVVDTSYSMQLQDQQIPLLKRAEGMIEDLLRGQLKQAKVAIFRSRPPPGDQPERLQSVAEIQSNWTGLRPQPSPKPLVDRVTAAADLLQRQAAAHKWLIVISDLQSREFPRPMPEFTDGRVILLDLHPDDPLSAGVTSVAIHPPQPIPGIASEAIVEITGRSGEVRGTTVSLNRFDGASLWQSPPLVANLDTTGLAQLRFPVRFPAERWLLVDATLAAQDALAWDDTRRQLIEIPPRQAVTILEPQTALPANRFIRLALDPNENKLSSWPLELRRAQSLRGDESVAVAVLTQWPDEPTARRLRDFVAGGGTLILFPQPGLEQAWEKLDEPARAMLTQLLPSAPAAQSPGGTHHAGPATVRDPLIKDLLEEKMQLGTIFVRRFMEFSVGDPSTEIVLNVSPATPGQGARSLGLLFRKKVGTGRVYTFATLPESRYTNLATHPIFLPLMVRMALRPAETSGAQNIELGNPLVLAGQPYRAIEQLEVQAPQGERWVVKGVEDSGGRKFSIDAADEPGLYLWRRVGESDAEPLAITNVQYPAVEADLVYRESASVVAPGPNVLVARSLEELQTKMATVSEPAPRWSTAIAFVLLLICLEALMASISSLWKPMPLRSFLPRLLGTQRA